LAAARPETRWWTDWGAVVKAPASACSPPALLVLGSLPARASRKPWFPPRLPSRALRPGLERPRQERARANSGKAAWARVFDPGREPAPHCPQTNLTSFRFSAQLILLRRGLRVSRC